MNMSNLHINIKKLIFKKKNVYAKFSSNSREKLHTTIQMKLYYKSSQVRYEYIDIEIET